MGVPQIRQLVYWEQFSAQPNSKNAPKVDTADPDRYPAGTWDLLDRLVASTTRRGDEAAAHAHRAGAEVGDEAPRRAT